MVLTTPPPVTDTNAVVAAQAGVAAEIVKAVGTAGVAPIETVLVEAVVQAPATVEVAVMVYGPELTGTVKVPLLLLVVPKVGLME
jgi:hypothetical protein